MDFTVKQLSQLEDFEAVCMGTAEADRKISVPFCCDLLSVAMSKVPEAAAWVTVMSNTNTLAVAALTEAACVVLAEGVRPDELMIEKAKEQQIAVICTKLPVFDAALCIYQKLNG